tara:strand:+ start:134 stop:937 length:804 start_codon:yes stop_codon:yes gene_type:complete
MLKKQMFAESTPTGDLSLEWFFKKRLEDTKSDEAKKKRERDLKVETLDWDKLDRTLKPLVDDFSEILGLLNINQKDLLKVTTDNPVFSKSNTNIVDDRYNNLETIVLSHIAMTFGNNVGSDLSRLLLSPIEPDGKREGSILFENDHFILTFWEGRESNHPELVSKVDYKFNPSSDKRTYGDFFNDLYERLSVFTRGNVSVDESEGHIQLGDIDGDITVKTTDEVYSKMKGFIGMVSTGYGDDCAIFNVSNEWHFVNYDHESMLWLVS